MPVISVTSGAMSGQEGQSGYELMGLNNLNKPASNGARLVRLEGSGCGENRSILSDSNGQQAIPVNRSLVDRAIGKVHCSHGFLANFSLQEKIVLAIGGLFTAIGAGMFVFSYLDFLKSMPEKDHTGVGRYSNDLMTTTGLNLIENYNQTYWDKSSYQSTSSSGKEERIFGLILFALGVLGCLFVGVAHGRKGKITDSTASRNRRQMPLLSTGRAAKIKSDKVYKYVRLSEFIRKNVLTTFDKKEKQYLESCFAKINQDDLVALLDSFYKDDMVAVEIYLKTWVEKIYSERSKDERTVIVQRFLEALGGFIQEDTGQRVRYGTPDSCAESIDEIDLMSSSDDDDDLDVVVAVIDVHRDKEGNKVCVVNCSDLTQKAGRE